MPNCTIIPSPAVSILPRRARTPGRFRFIHPNAILRLFDAGVHAIEIVQLSVMRLSGSNGDMLLRHRFNKLLRSVLSDNRERRSSHFWLPYSVCKESFKADACVVRPCRRHVNRTAAFVKSSGCNCIRWPHRRRGINARLATIGAIRISAWLARHSKRQHFLSR